MIEKILERLEERRNDVVCMDDDDYFMGKSSGFEEAKEIVQEVAKEYGYCKKLTKCDSCVQYISEELVPPICYFCCKGIEDNYERKGE